MDFHKLKLDKFSTYNGINLPQDFHPPLSLHDTPEVFFSFVSNVNDVMTTINNVQNHQTHKENRVFFVFKKGNKSFGRDHIYSVVMKNSRFKRKAPVLASLSEEYSVFCFMFEF